MVLGEWALCHTRCEMTHFVTQVQMRADRETMNEEYCVQSEKPQAAHWAGVIAVWPVSAAHSCALTLQQKQDRTEWHIACEGKAH